MCQQNSYFSDLYEIALHFVNIYICKRLLTSIMVRLGLFGCLYNGIMDSYFQFGVLIRTKILFCLKKINHLSHSVDSGIASGICSSSLVENVNFLTRKKLHNQIVYVMFPQDRGFDYLVGQTLFCSVNADNV